MVASGSWPSTKEGKLKWAQACGSNHSTSPLTSCPGSTWMTTASEGSLLQTRAKREGKPRRLNLLRRRLTSMEEQYQDVPKSSTGQSTGLDSCCSVLVHRHMSNGHALNTDNGHLSHSGYLWKVWKTSKDCHSWELSLHLSWGCSVLFCVIFVHSELRQWDKKKKPFKIRCY